MSDRLTTILSTRVTAKVRKKFLRKAKRFGDPSYVHRELINAFVEDRVTMEPPDNINPLFGEENEH
jgi:hypothetical protein